MNSLRGYVLPLQTYVLDVLLLERPMYMYSCPRPGTCHMEPTALVVVIKAVALQPVQSTVDLTNNRFTTTLLLLCAVPVTQHTCLGSLHCGRCAPSCMGPKPSYLSSK